MSATWTPPEQPNPTEILHSAVADTRTGDYEQALAKFLWFHHNALLYESGQYGVRLSFALGYWGELATVYPPAEVAFKRTRDEAEESFRGNPTNFQLFHDIAALNWRLEDEVRTAELFAAVAESNPVAAQRLYQVAEPHLISSGRYSLCGSFLQPTDRVARAAECYQSSKRFEDSRTDFPIEIPKHAWRSFVKNVATLVALLVLNGRNDDASAAYEAGLAVIDDEEFRTILDAAMSGHLPER